MCDYSMEHLKTTKVVEGETYKFDARLTHGFVTRDSSPYAITAACVVPGQRLKLTKPMFHQHIASALNNIFEDELIVTVVSRRDDRIKYNKALGPWNDGLELPDGRVVPVAHLIYAIMELVPVEKKKPTKKRNIARLLGLDKARELVDAD